MKKNPESKGKITVKDILNKAKSVIKNKNLLLILSLIIIIALSSLLYYYLVLNKSKCSDGQSSPCSTETSSNKEEDTDIDNSKCVLTQEEYEISYLDAKNQINKALELTKKKKIKVIFTGNDDGTWSEETYIYDPINQTYTGEITKGIDSETTRQITKVFKDNLLIVKDKNTGEEIERKEAEFIIDALDYITWEEDDISNSSNKGIFVDDDGYPPSVSIYTFVSKNPYNYMYYEDYTPDVLYDDFTATYEISGKGYITRIEYHGESFMRYLIEVL